MTGCPPTSCVSCTRRWRSVWTVPRQWPPRRRRRPSPTPRRRTSAPGAGDPSVPAPESGGFADLGVLCGGGEVADDLVVAEPGQPLEPGVLGRPTQVDHEHRAPAGAGEEVAVDAVGVEAAHRSGGEPRGADAEQEVAGLEGCVEPGGLDPLV